MKKQGLTILLTGLPEAGKTSIAKELSICLSRIDSRNNFILDGDSFRNFFHNALSFSKKDRDINARAISFFAYEITKKGKTTRKEAV